MTDWKKLKVAELKDECKARDIPLTGLKLKQHYIDKLEEYELNGVGARGAGAQEGETAETPIVTANENGFDQAEPLNGEISTGVGEAENAIVAEKEEDSRVESRVEDEAKIQPSDNDVSKVEPLAATDGYKPTPEKPSEPSDENDEAEENQSGQKDRPTDESSNTLVQTEAGRTEPTVISTVEAHDQDKSKDPRSHQIPVASFSVPLSPESAQDSAQIHATEPAEHQRKRKRSSATPAPTEEEVAPKRAKTEDETTQTGDKEDVPMPQIEEVSESTKPHGRRDVPPEVSEVSEVVCSKSEGTKAVDSAKEASLRQPIEHLQTKSDDGEVSSDRELSPMRDVAPSIHPPTSSLYIRNFKRPLHIPSLKQHVADLSKSRSDPDTSQIKTFYLDSIRSHAFVSFTSPSAASRVRAAMHGTRFPDEPQRELLFVDYIPDDNIQDWIDLETGSGFGRGGNNKRFEVVYSRGPGGVKATLHDGESPRQRPPLPPQRNALSNAPRAPAASAVHGVHPDRAGLLQGRQDRKNLLPERSPPPIQKRDAPGETGFKALDELFSFTTTKPKLYYKPVAPRVVDDRLDMIKGLRVGHTDMGRSGDEGMKRYTFETIRGREEWVNKGPEFGHGQRGQAILRRGERARGRGGFRPGRGGDSWRA